MNAIVPGTVLENVPQFKTDLFMPSYKEGRRKNWEIQKIGLCFDYGYHSGVWLLQDLAVLIKHGADGDARPKSWMCPSPHEIESQELGCRHASGHTVVMGLGLGWVAVNTALNPEVTSVTIVEIDRDVIDLVEDLSLLAQLPDHARQKITIHNADALEWRPDRSVDFLYIDIWRELGESRALDQVRQMQANVQAPLIYFWGQELAIYNEMQTGGVPALTSESVASCVRDRIRLPLLVPGAMDYAGMIGRVVENRKKRLLPLKRD